MKTKLNWNHVGRATLGRTSKCHQCCASSPLLWLGDFAFSVVFLCVFLIFIARKCSLLLSARLILPISSRRKTFHVHKIVLSLFFFCFLLLSANVLRSRAHSYSVRVLPFVFDVVKFATFSIPENNVHDVFALPKWMSTYRFFFAFREHINRAARRYV